MCRVNLRDAAQRSAQRLANTFESAATLGGTQQFLGASWVNWMLTATPQHRRYAVARRLLSLSPHYIYVQNDFGTKAWPRPAEIEAELDRNRVSRAQLVRDLIAPRVSPTAVVLDYGCGPGYAAAATAERTKRVYAADIAAGVLRCAEVLHSRPNLKYVLMESGGLQGIPDATIDIAYSFAVFQHMTDQAAKQALGEIARVTRPDGTLLLHVIVAHPELQTEQEWFADRSVKSRLRARVSLHVFSRSRDQLLALVSAAGFRDVGIVPASTLTDVDDDVAHDTILTAKRTRDVE